MSLSVEYNEIMFFWESVKRKLMRMQEHERTNPALPEDVLNHIFSFLPIKKAVQTGIVSPKFQKSWTLCRSLIFDREFGKKKERAEYVSIVNRVSELHSGSKIQLFHLYFIPIEADHVVENWIRQATQKGVEQLELNFVQEKFRYRLPSEFLDVPSLKVLKLCYCEIDLSPDVQGLRLLETVVLRKIKLTPEVVETLFRTCTLLESFDVTECHGVGPLNVSANDLRRFKVLKVGNCKDVSRIQISAPNLHTFYYHGKFIPFKFENTPRLINVMTTFSKPRGLTRCPHIGTLATNLSRVVILTVSGAFVEELSWRMICGQYFVFPCLLELQLIMEGARYCNLFDVACLLNQCPAVERLFIDMNGSPFEAGKDWELHQKPIMQKFIKNLNFLRMVKLNGFRFHGHEAELVKFLLQKAKFLDALHLITPQSNRVKICAPEVMRCQCLFMAWKTAPTNIIVYEHDNDTRGVYPRHLKRWYNNFNLF